MKCFIRKLLGTDFFNDGSGDMCVPLPPIVSSLIGSVVFIALMTIASHLVR